jgi:hypothetical protein
MRANDWNRYSESNRYATQAFGGHVHNEHVSAVGDVVFLLEFLQELPFRTVLLVKHSLTWKNLFESGSTTAYSQNR